MSVTNILESNKPINSLTKSIGNFFGGASSSFINGVRKSTMNDDVLKTMGYTKNGDGRIFNKKGDEITFDNYGFADDMSFTDRMKMAHMNEDGTYSGSRIAGSALMGYMGVSTAYRLASGGGIYKDSDGNTDIIGIPFI